MKGQNKKFANEKPENLGIINNLLCEVQDVFTEVAELLELNQSGMIGWIFICHRNLHIIRLMAYIMASNVT